MRGVKGACRFAHGQAPRGVLEQLGNGGKQRVAIGHALRRTHGDRACRSIGKVECIRPNQHWRADGERFDQVLAT